MDDYLNKKEKYMEKVTKYLNKKQKYLTALKTFDDFNKQYINEQKRKQEKTLKEEFENKLNTMKQQLLSQLKEIKNNLNKNKKVNQESKKINKETIQAKRKKEKEINTKNIEDFFQSGQIFSMNNEYIIATTDKNGLETVYKKGDHVLNGFVISNITTSMITLEKDNQLYFYNIKRNLGSKLFSEVKIKMPTPSGITTKITNQNNNQNKIPVYKTPEERKKELAKKFFNIKN